MVAPRIRASVDAASQLLWRVRYVQAELSGAREQLSQRAGETELLREQARLSVSLVRAAEERAELKQHALDAARREAAEAAAAAAAARGELHGVQKDKLPGQELALQRANEELQQVLHSSKGGPPPYPLPIEYALLLMLHLMTTAPP